MRTTALALLVLSLCAGCGGDGATPRGASDPAVSRLIAALHEGSATHGEAVAALITSGAAAVPELIRVAQASKDTLQRVRVVLILGEMGPAAESAIPALEEIVKEQVPHLAESAASALKNLRRKRPAEKPREQTWEEWWEENRTPGAMEAGQSK